jgi:hypothetical protein
MCFLSDPLTRMCGAHAGLIHLMLTLRVEDGGDQNASEEPAPKRRKGGYSGAWRVHVREVTNKDPALWASMAEVSRRYYARDEETQRRHAQLSAAGVSQRRQGATTSFGRKASLLTAQARRTATVQRLRLNSEKSERDPIAATTDIVAGAMARGSSARSAVQDARAVSRFHAVAAAEELQRIAHDLESFDSNEGQHHRRNFEQRAPAGISHMLRAVPSERGSLFEVVSGGPDVAKRSVAWLCENYKQSNLGPILDAFITNLHRPLLERNCIDVDWRDAEGDPPNPICAAAGQCICIDSTHREKYHFRNAVLRILKLLCPFRSGSRQKLADGYCVLQFTWPQGDTDEESAGEIFLHVGLQYLSPFRPSWQLMQRAIRHPCGEPPPDEARIYLQVMSRSSVL